jgi:hypothetical protein
MNALCSPTDSPSREDFENRPFLHWMVYVSPFAFELLFHTVLRAVTDTAVRI